MALLGLIMVVLLPALALGAMVAWEAIASHRTAAEERLRETAAALALAVDRDIASQVAALNAFSVSPAIMPRLDLVALHGHAGRVAAQLGAPLMVLGPDGTQRLNSSLPLGTALPPTTDAVMVSHAFAAGRPVVSDLFFSTMLQRHTAMIGVSAPGPDGDPLLLATAPYEPQRLRGLLAAQRLPASVFAAVVDARQVLVARSDALHESLLGHAIPPQNVRHFLGREAGLYRAVALDGRDRIFAFHAVPSAPGWFVMVSEIADAFVAAWRAPLLALAAGGALALLLGAALALLAARRILVPLRHLSRHACAIAAAGGESSAEEAIAAAALPPIPVAELEAVRRGLVAAEATLRHRAAALAASEARFRGMAEAVPDMLFEADVTGAATWASTAWLRTTGMTATAVAGCGWTAAIHPDDRRMVLPEWEAAIRTGRDFVRRLRLHRAVDGAWRWHLMRARAQRGPDGHIERWLGAAADVHDLIEVQAAFAAGEARLRAVLDNVPVGVALAEAPSGRIVLSNRRLWEIWRRPRLPAEGVAACAAGEGYHPDGRRVADQEYPLARALTGEEAPSLEYRGRRGDGSLVWLRSTAAPVRDEMGAITGAVIATVDIDAERRAAEALAESEARLRTIVETVPVGLVMAELPSGRIIGGNAYVETLLRHPVLRSPDIHGYDEWVSFHADGTRVDGHEYPLARMVMAGEENPSIEVHYQRGDGTRAWTRIMGRPVRNAAGEITGGVVALVDVDRERSATEALAESEGRLRLALEGARAGIYVSDYGTGRATGDAVCAALHGLDPEAAAEGVPAETWVATIHPADRAAVVATLDRARSDPDGRYEAEYRIPLPDGDERWIAARGRFEPDPAGGPARRLRGISFDITATKRAEAALQRHNRQLDLLARVAERLLLGETPAVMLKGCLDILAEALGVELYFSYLVEADGDGERLVLESSAGLDEAQRDAFRYLRFGQALCGTIALQRHPLVLERLQGRSDALTEKVRALGVQAYAGHPLLAGGRLIGTLSFGSTRRTAFTTEELALMRAVADQVAAAMERVRLETAVRESEERLRLCIERAPAGIAMFDTEMRYLAVSRRYLQDYGLEAAAGPAALLGRSHYEVFPDLPNRWHAMHRRVLAGETLAAQDDPFPRADGGTDWVRWEMTPWRRADGLVGGAILFSEVVTARLEAERAMTESEARFRALAEVMPQLVWASTPEGYADYFNPRWYAYTGQAPGTAEGEGWMRALHPEDRAHTVAAWEQALATGGFYQVEYRLRGADGSYRWFLARGSPVHDASSGRILHWFGTCTDISEIVAAREDRARHAGELERLVEERTRELRESEARLAQASKMEALGRLAGGIAHDFNNVLQAVQGGVALAIRRLRRDPEQARQFLDLALEATERGAAVTGRLLSFARRGELSAAPVEPAPLLNGLAQMLRHGLGPAITLRVRAAPDLPAMVTDAAQLEAVLVNLANNARDALTGGSGTVVLGAELVSLPYRGSPVPPRHLAPGAYIRISVADDGEGMPPEVLARVAEPFFTTKPKGKGTGLGLAMARGFAEQSGGGFSIESAPGRGTTVSLWLPRAPAGSGSRSDGQRPADLAVPPAAKPHGTVLLVDDEPGVRAVLSAALAEQGHAVVEAEDTAAALARMAEGRAVDVLVTDLAMPGGADGLALIREARRRRPGLPAVLVTGHVGDAAQAALEEAAGTGPFTVLRKPASAEAVEAQVTALLQGTARLVAPLEAAPSLRG